MIKVELAAARPAVLVTDVQTLFAAPDGPFANTSAESMIEALNRFLPACRADEIPVVFANYVFRDDRADAGLLRDMPWVRDGLMGASSPWVAVDPRVERSETDIEVRHNRPSAFYASELDAVLRGLRVDTLLLCGLSTNNAISATARDAFARDIPVLVVRDCTAAAPWESETETYFAVLDTWTAEVASLDDVLARLAARTPAFAPS